MKTVTYKGHQRHRSAVSTKFLSSLSMLLMFMMVTSFYMGFNYGATKQQVATENSLVDFINNSNDSEIGHPDAQKRISFFKETAKSFTPFTDKIGDSSRTGRDMHRYHNMYGNFLLPFAAAKPNFKFLEIGMGCNMSFGYGASVKLWKKLFPKADLWEAEYDEKCVNEAKGKGLLDGMNVLVGDQADEAVLDKWIEQSGGKFDVIIDDGGHANCQILKSFEKLWPQLNPGGYYYIEDLHVGNFYRDWKKCGKISDMMQEWQMQLIFLTTLKQNGIMPKYPLPEDMIFVHCQGEACVLGKRHSEINDPYVPAKGE